MSKSVASFRQFDDYFIVYVMFVDIELMQNQMCFTM
jgi:hypothetical protein